MSLINFDANASYGVYPHIVELISRNYSTLNPSSVHRGGQHGKNIIEEARAILNKALGITDRSATTLFTSGATEGNNAAILSPFWLKRSSNLEIVAPLQEHPSVLMPIRRLEKLGARVSWIPSLADGGLDKERLLAAVTDKTDLVVLMLANNESGIIHPVASVVSAIRARNREVLVHCDATQAFGKTAFTFSELNVDTLTVSGHKIGSLPGVGALIIKDKDTFQPLMLGGAQEHHLRAGTENVLGIRAFAEALQIVFSDLPSRIERMKVNRDSVRSKLAEVAGIRFNFQSAAALPNTLSVTIPGVLADDLVVALDLEGVLISSGAACASGKPEPSHVLLSTGMPEREVRETVRISLSAEYAPGELERGVAAIVKCIKQFDL